MQIYAVFGSDFDANAHTVEAVSYFELRFPLLADTGYKQQPESKGRLLISKLPFPKRDFQRCV